MKVRIALLCAFLSSAVFAHGQSKTDAAQVLSTAEITKIDVKKKSLQVHEVVDPQPQQGRTGGGRGGGGGNRRNGGGFPGGGGGRRRTGGGGNPGGRTGGVSAKKAKQFKVFVLKDTEMTFAQAKIDFAQLHIGDRIAVSGTPKGSKGDLEAKRIERF